MPKLRLDKPRGVLGTTSAEPVAHARFLPSEELAPFMEHYWLVRWEVDEPRVAEVLAHPSIHVVFERGCSSVSGPARGRFTRVIEGRGVVLGAKFLPGGFRSCIDMPLSRFTDHRFSLVETFGEAAIDLEERVLAFVDRDQLDSAIAEIEAFVSGLRPKVDANIKLAGRIASRVAEDRSITKVEHIAKAFGMGVRKLQRLSMEYLGVTPKWVIQRYRLHEAAERIGSGAVVSWADLAIELGYSDQAHFIRDFKKIVGHSPASYSLRVRPSAKDGADHRTTRPSSARPPGMKASKLQR